MATNLLVVLLAYIMVEAWVAAQSEEGPAFLRLPNHCVRFGSSRSHPSFIRGQRIGTAFLWKKESTVLLIRWTLQCTTQVIYIHQRPLRHRVEVG